MNTKYKLYVHDLVLEVTRRCNMCCAHCMRGDAQALDMNKDVIDRVIDMVDEIGCVVFTGGEPTLNLEIIRYFYDELKRRGKDYPASFYIVTNGKENQKELALLALDLYSVSDEKDMCGVAISVDDFHEWSDPKNSILHGLSFYVPDKDYTDRKYYLIKEGRAANMQGRDPDLNVLPDCDIFDDTIDIHEELYVSADGKLFGNCDCSYEHVDDLSKYSVYKPDDFITALMDENK